MSTTFPTSPSFAAVDFRIISPGLSTESFSGKFRRVSIGTQYYSFGVQFPNVTAREFGPVAAFIAAQRGSFNDFDIILPEISFSKGQNFEFIGAPQVFLGGGSLPAGTTAIPVNALDSGQARTEVMRAGDFIRFANHTKVYMLTANVDSNNAGEATMSITPGLIEPVPVGTLLTTTAVPFRAVLEDFEQEYSVSFGGITTMELRMREVF